MRPTHIVWGYNFADVAGLELVPAKKEDDEHQVPKDMPTMKRYLVTPATGQVPHVPDVDATLKFVPGYCGPGSGDGGE